MINKQEKTIVLVAGLPYSGKTAIIHGMMNTLPGAAIYIDSVFREFVPESEVCLVRWLQAGTELVERIQKKIENTNESIIYVEIGILQQQHRKSLSEWINHKQYHCIPILLNCSSEEAVAARQAMRAKELATNHNKLKIAIGLDELYGPISTAFQIPEEEEGYIPIDTSSRIEQNIAEISSIFTSLNTAK